jgi:hypothetical protein
LPEPDGTSNAHQQGREFLVVRRGCFPPEGVALWGERGVY